MNEQEKSAEKLLLRADRLVNRCPQNVTKKGMICFQSLHNTSRKGVLLPFS